MHVAFGNVLGTDRKMLKSRTGESMKFVELLDEALSAAAVAIDEKYLDPTADERVAVVHMIGIGAVKYATSPPTGLTTTCSTGPHGDV